MRQAAFLLMALTLLSSCGKRPDVMDAPEGVTTAYPRHYPDVKTDPPGVYIPSSK